MFALLKKIFPFSTPLRLQDPDFGQIRFFPDAGNWIMENDWLVSFQPQGISCVAIPGDRSGPTPDARAFLLSKRSEHEQIWSLCEPFVRECMSGWDAFNGIPPRDAFFLSCINKDGDSPNGWEVCFETREGLKWVYFCLQIEGDEVVSNTVTT